MNDSALVIGGAGFIGSHLCKLLLHKGCQVTCLDNYSSGSKSTHIAGVTYINGDAKDVNSICLPVFDKVFHFGEYPRVEPSFDNIDAVFNNNLVSIYPVLDFANKCGAKLIYSSTSSGFSKYESPGSMSPYTFVKQLNVDIIKQYSAWTNLDYAICYFYNVYGPGEIGSGEFATVVEKFLQLRESGATHAPVSSPGTQVRNFTHVNDTVKGIDLVAQLGNGNGYSIGSQQQVSIIELASMIGLVPVIGERVKGNRTDSQLDCKAVRSLGWQCEESISDYIQQRLHLQSVDHKEKR